MKKLLTSVVLVSCCALLSACSVNAVKAPEEAVKPVVLEGTSWMMQVPAEAECAVTPMLEFGPNNTVTGDLGCNRASGSFEFDGTNILFDKVATTRRVSARSTWRSKSRDAQHDVRRALGEARREGTHVP